MLQADRDKDRDRDGTEPPASDEGGGARRNIAPDAVKDPNEKTDGKPGHPGQGEEADPGAG
ncbi:hypothetical protein [Methylobacterium organophilum]|uniref:hypothetical protein n=1 Tax=Methylobacterium organophilum TaxID=410 RepID=UPI003B84878F